jgi:toxin YoeB
VNVHFSDDGWDDYLHWTRTDSDRHRRLNELIEDVRRHPFMGLARPEALKGDLSGWWSRRISGETGWCIECRAQRARTSASRSSSAGTTTEPAFLPKAMDAGRPYEDLRWSRSAEA